MILIKNARLSNEKIVDILIEDDKIKSIEENIKANDMITINAKNMYVLPMMIELNANLRDNKLNKKNIDELEKRAIKSGFSTVVLSTNIDDKNELELLADDLKKRKLDFILSIKGLNKESRLNNISILTKAGAKVIQENSDITSNQLRRISQYALMKSIPLFIFAQNRELNENGVVNEDEVSFELGLPGISKVGEISEVAKVSAMSEYYNVKTLFQTISTQKSIDILQNVKKEYSEVYIEVSLHHLLKNSSLCKNFNTFAKINPPLRGEKQQKLLIDSLKEGKIDTLTSLYSPQSITRKDVSFDEASFGIDFIEEFLPLAYTNLIDRGIISMENFIKLTIKNPAKILDIEPNSIEIGKKANLIIFDPNYETICQNKQSLYFHDKIKGRIVTSILKGEMV